VTRDTMLHMMFKLGQCAEKKWRRLRGFAYLAKVIEGVKFVNGEEVTDLDQVAACSLHTLDWTIALLFSRRRKLLEILSVICWSLENPEFSNWLCEITVGVCIENANPFYFF
jgi:hypothetical protein